MFLVLLLNFISAQDKLICACVSSKCVSDDKCTSAPQLDPTSPTFNDDFTVAKGSSKDITFYTNMDEDSYFSLDLMILAGLNMNFSSRAGIITIDFNYNDQDFGANNFNFDRLFKPQFVPIGSVTILKFGSLTTEKEAPLFSLSGGNKIDVYYHDMTFSTKSLDNVKGIYKTAVGKTTILLEEADVVDFIISNPTTDSKISINGIPHFMSYTKDDTYNFTGTFEQWEQNDKLNIVIGSNVDISTIPTFDIKGITSVDISGKLWVPSMARPMKTIQKILYLSIPAGDFPFNIYSDTIKMNLKGNAILYGTIDAYSWEYASARLYLSTNLTARVNLDIKGMIDGRIYPTSPLLDVLVEDYTLNTSDPWEGRDFPIGYSFNNVTNSMVKVNKIHFKGGNTTTSLFSFTAFPELDHVFTDAELDANEHFSKGFNFLELPIGTLTTDELETTVSHDASSQLHGIPGFTSNNYCMGVNRTQVSKLIISAKKVMSAFDAPAMICVTKNFAPCEYPPNAGSVYRNVETIVDGDLSKYIYSQNTKIVIGTTIKGNTISLNFDTLKSESINVTIIGVDAQSQFSIQDNKGKIDHLTLMKIKLMNAFNFQGGNATFLNTDFSVACTFAQKTAVFSDLLSFSSLTAKNSEIEISGPVEVYHEKIMQQENSYSLQRLLVFNNKQLDLQAIETDTSSGNTTTYKATITSGKVKNISYYGQSFHDLYEMNTQFIIKATSIDIDFSQVNVIFVHDFSFFKLEDSGFTDKLKNPINIIHGTNKLNVFLSMPGQAEGLKFVGSGSLHYAHNYKNYQKYCIYSDAAAKSCKSSSSYGRIDIKNDEKVNDVLKTLDNYSMEFVIDYSDKAITIPMSVMNSKQVKMSTYYNSENKAATVNFDLDTADVVQKYTSLSVENIIIGRSGTNKVATFGIIEFVNKIEFTKDWTENVDVGLLQLECTFSDLYLFKGLTISDQLVLTGEMPQGRDPLTIKFIQDENANDLVMDVNGNCTIAAGSDFVKLNNFTFNITHSHQYDALFKVKKQDAHITVECAPGVTESNFVKFDIATAGNVEVTFKGTFPESTDSLIRVRPEFYSNCNATVRLEASAPASIRDYTYTFIHLLQPDMKLTGPIDFINDFSKDNSDAQILVHNDASQPAKLEIKDGINLKSTHSSKPCYFIGLQSENLTVIVEKLILPYDFIKVNASFINTIGRSGSSKVVLNEQLPKGVVFFPESRVISLVTGKIEDESTFPFLSKAETFLQANRKDLADIHFNFSYVIDDSIKDRTHGFYVTMNCLSVEHKDNELQLKGTLSPGDIPFIVDIVPEGMKTNGELIIKSNDQSIISELNTHLPDKFTGIVLRLYAGMDESYPLDFTKLADKKDNLVVTILSPDIGSVRNCYVTRPSSKVLNLSFWNVNLGISEGQGNDIVAKFINFTDCEFLNIGKFNFAEANIGSMALDVDSLNGLIQKGALKTFHNNLTIQAANVVTFNKDGWIFSENIAKKGEFVAANSFDHVTFETSMSCLLQLESAEVTKIKGFTLNAYPLSDGTSKMELGTGWGKVTDLGGFHVNTHHSNLIKLYSASYPIPKGIFELPESMFSYIFNYDINKKFDGINYENGRVLQKYEFKADLTHLMDKDQYIRGETVTFKDYVAYILVDKKGTLQFKTPSIDDRTNFTASTLETLGHLNIGKGSKVKSNLKFNPSSSVSIHWTLDQMPLVVQDKLIQGSSPQKFELIYDDSTVNKDLYRQMLLNKNGIAIVKGKFDCNNLRKNLEFGGSYKPFGAGNSHITLRCDISYEGNVLLLSGVKDIIDGDDDDDSKDGGKGGKISTGSIIGIVIGIIIVIVIGVGAFFFIRRRKMEGYINTDVYHTSLVENKSLNSYDINPKSNDPFEES